MTTTTNSNTTETGKSSPGWKDIVATIVGIVALVGFALFIAYLLPRTTTADELPWTRAVYLLSGVEAIAFAATGFFFGKEVNRKRAESAEGDRDEANKRVNAAQARTNQAENRATEAETKGKTLAAAIKAKAAGQRGKGKIKAFVALEGREAVQVTQVEFGELEALADQLFP